MRLGHPEAAPTGRSTEQGIALVAAVGTLAAVATLALATLLLLEFDIRLARNRQAAALASSEAHARLVVALLELEAEASGGELPVDAPDVPGMFHYERASPRLARVGVVSEGPGVHLREALIELREVGGTWRVHMIEGR